MQIAKTFSQSLYEPKTGTRKLVNKTVVIGVYPTLTNDQLVAIIKEYAKNPEPDTYYFVYNETKRDVVYRQGFHDEVAFELQKRNCIRILDPLCVNKTYPAFWKDFKKLTGASFEIPRTK